MSISGKQSFLSIQIDWIKSGICALGRYSREKKAFRKSMLTVKKIAAIILLGLHPVRPPIRKTLTNENLLNRPAVFFEGANSIQKMDAEVIYGGNEKNQARFHYEFWIFPYGTLPAYAILAAQQHNDEFCKTRKKAFAKTCLIPLEFISDGKFN